MLELLESRDDHEFRPYCDYEQAVDKVCCREGGEGGGSNGDGLNERVWGRFWKGDRKERGYGMMDMDGRGRWRDEGRKEGMDTIEMD